MTHNIRYFLNALIICIILFSALPCFGDEKKKVTVLELSTINLPASYARIARNSIEVWLFKKGNFQLLERHEVEMIFNELKIKEDDCKQTTCIVDIGKTLSADFALSGTIRKAKKYEITLKLISINNAEIAAIYKKEFNDEKDIDPVIKDVIDNITEDIPYYLNHGTVKRPEKPSMLSTFDYYITANILYFMPVGKFSKIITPGFGASIQADAGNIILKNLLTGIYAGYIYANGTVNPDDQAFFIPVELSLKYKFNIIKDLEILPTLSSGLEMIYLKHGTGYGFRMDDNSTSFFKNPVAETGFNINYKFYSPLSLSFFVIYGVIFEEESNHSFINSSLGIQFLF